MPNEKDDQKQKILNIVLEAIKRDDELRSKYQVAGKFRFIRDRLQALLKTVEENLAALQVQKEKRKEIVLEDEEVVYVHLFNAQGSLIQTWYKMLNPEVFYEHSVNRPIYTKKSDIEAYIRSRPNRLQHGYLAVAVKKQFILTPEEPLKDSGGYPLSKVKEGSLKLDKLISFTHNGNEFVLNEEGELEKKADYASK